MSIECAREKTNENDFHFNYKENTHTHCYVKSRRINYAEKRKKNYFNKLMKKRREEKATFIRSLKDNETVVLRSTVCKEIIYKSRFSWMNFVRKKKINAFQA